MARATARVATGSGAKYVQQLCKHWAHKLEVELTDSRGQVRFPTAVCIMDADAGGVTVTIEGDDPADVERLTGVVERHLDRFAFREAPLGFNWS